MMYGMMGGFSIFFVIVYIGLVIYFFYLLTTINNSLKRIANQVERISESKAVSANAPTE